MKKVCLLRLPIILGAIPAIGATAFAPMAEALTVRKQIAGTATVVIIDGGAVGQRLAITLAGSNLKRSVTANACGQLRLTISSVYVSPTNINIDGGGTIAVGSLPTQNYRCSNGVVVNSSGAAVVPSGNFKDASGAVTIVGKTTNQRYAVEYVGVPASFTSTVNGCGFASIRHNPTSTTSPRDMTSFTVDGTSYTLAGIADSPAPICRSIGGVNIRYNPVP